MKRLGFPLPLSLGLLTAAVLIACGRSDLDLPYDAGVSGMGGQGGSTAAGGRGGSAAAGGSFGTGGVVTGRAGAGGAAGQPGSGGQPGTAGALGMGGVPTGGTVGAGGRIGMGGSGAGGLATGGTPGAGGLGAGGAGATTLIPINCGSETCTAGTETCCIQASGGLPSESCIPNGQSCAGGISISCLNGAACGAGQVCCLSALDASALCLPAALCTDTLGLALCASNAECPASAPNCCGSGRTGFCFAGSCLP